MSVVQLQGKSCPLDSLNHHLNRAKTVAEATACSLGDAVRHPEQASYQGLVSMADSLRTASHSIEIAANAVKAGGRS